MRIEQYENVVREERVLTQYRVVCDRCDKLIYSEKTREKNSPQFPKKYISYYSVTTGHNDWGNDSVESIEQMDICSPGCLRSLFDDYCGYYEGTGSQYMNIEHICKGIYAGEE